MNYLYIPTLLITVLVFSGCTAKSKGFFEDIYSQTEVRSAGKGDYNTVQAQPKEAKKQTSQQPIKQDTPTQTINISQAYKAEGRIIESNYDEDVELFVYVFLESGKETPIIFYYNKDLKSIGKKINITVKENFLTNISQNSEIKNQRTEQKRKKSTIKTPIIEKINTL